MTRGKSYPVTAGTTYTLADFGGAGTLIQIIDPKDRTTLTRGRVRVGIDSSIMTPAGDDPFTLASDTTKIVFSRDCTIITYTGA